jgi:hypothetical protein
MSVASIASYMTWFASSMSEASLLAVWGGALLVVARGVRARQIASGTTQPAAADLQSATAVRLGAGA